MIFEGGSLTVSLTRATLQIIPLPFIVLVSMLELTILCRHGNPLVLSQHKMNPLPGERLIRDDEDRPAIDRIKSLTGSLPIKWLI